MLDPILILLIAMVVVIGGVLWLRLHAFIALTAGALVVGLLTSDDAVFRSELEGFALRITSIDTATGEIEVRGRNSAVPGQTVIFRREQDGVLQQVGEAELQVRDTPEGERTVLVPGTGAEIGDVIMHRTQVAAARSTAGESVGSRIAAGFGSTCEKIGILIAMAAIIGMSLLESGAAERVVNSIRRALGEERAAIGFTVSGFVVGIPVFFDTVFYLLIPLAKALGRQTGKNYLLYVLAIIVGATMAHSLVPPTPGPLFVASELGVPIGDMMLAGVVIGLFAVTFGYLYSVWANRRWVLPMRTTAMDDDSQNAETETAVPKKLPSLWLSLAPIVLPVVLLGGNTVLEMMYGELPVDQRPAWLVQSTPVLDLLGDKNIALIIAAAIALATLAWWKRAGRMEMAKSVQRALASGAIIILITAAGGAFGHVLRQTGIASAIQERFPATESGTTLLLIAFGITAVVRIAQGSATVAMITSVSIVGPLASTIQLPFNPVYLALAIGCGSKPIPWMNDSGFWVVGQMSGMTEAESLKTFSIALTLMGFAGLAATLLAAAVFPLV